MIFSDDMKVYNWAEVIHCAVTAHITNNFTLEWKLGTRLSRFHENDNKPNFSEIRWNREKHKIYSSLTSLFPALFFNILSRQYNLAFQHCKQQNKCQYDLRSKVVTPQIENLYLKPVSIHKCKCKHQLQQTKKFRK